MNIRYIPNWKIRHILDANPTTVWYAMNTNWWTHRREHLYRSSNHGGIGIPCCPRNSPLFEIPFQEWYLPEKIENCYPGGIETLMAGHHGNIWYRDPNLLYWPSSLSDSENFTRYEKAHELVSEWHETKPSEQTSLLLATASRAATFYEDWPSFADGRLRRY